MAQLIHSVLPMPRRPIAFIDSGESVKKSIEIMTERNIGALVVRDADNTVLGLVSERDIIQSCLNKGLDVTSTKVADIVFKHVAKLSPEDFVETAMQVITETKRRHVLIYDKDELTAIISIGDLLFYLLDDKARVIEQLEQYIAT